MRVPIGRCDQCHLLVYTSNGYIEVTGWVPSRSSGGFNQIRHHKRTGRVLCNGCYRLYLDTSKGRTPIHPDQMTLGGMGGDTA